MIKRSDQPATYTVLDRSVPLLSELHEGHWPVPNGRWERDGDRETARRAAQWPTWQIDRSRPERFAERPLIEHKSVCEARFDGVPWLLAVTYFVALTAVGVGLLAVGVETGLL